MVKPSHRVDYVRVGHGRINSKSVKLGNFRIN